MSSGKRRQGQRRQQKASAAPQAGGSAPGSSGQAPAAQPAAQTDKSQLKKLIENLEKARGSRVIVYWTSDLARISEAAVIPLYDQLKAIGKTDKLDLFLFTRGGDTEVPWRMVSLIREFCDTFGVLVPHRASSSGTLLALGADEIVMTPLGVLGPIDPSRTHPLLPKASGSDDPEPVSVQDMRHAMQFIREAAGTDKEMPYTPEAMAQIFTALFDKIHPLAIGAIEQSYALSKLIGKRCLETHMNADTDSAKIGEIVDRLCDGYKSHGYQINRREAREIGLSAVDASDEVEVAMTELYRAYVESPFHLLETPPRPNTTFDLNLAWLDSAVLNLRVEGTYEMGQNGQLVPQGDRWVPY